MKKPLKIVWNLILLSFFFFAPNFTHATEIDVGDLVKLQNSSSIYSIQPDKTRLIFQNQAVYNSYFNNFDNVKTVSLEEISKYPFAGNIILNKGSLMKFDTSPKIYQVKDGGELEWIKTEAGFKSLGYSFSKVITLSEVFFRDYKIRTENGVYDDVLSKIKSKFVNQDKIDNIDQVSSSTKGLVEALGDEYSVYWTEEEYNKFLSWINNDSFEGIGAQVDMVDGWLTIVSPIQGSPSEKAGLKAGDKVKFIDNFDTTGKDVNSLIILIRGPKGTEVTLRVERVGENELIPITIIRDTIIVNQFKWETKTTNKGKNIAYLDLSQFSQGAWEDFISTSDDILNTNPDGMILDLRNNPGGYLSMAIDVSSRWLKSGDLILSENRAGDEVIEHSANGLNYFMNIPLVILVNRGSASASEIVAGALQDHEVATIIGEKTFGKGVVQEVILLSDGSVIKLTVSEWLTPNKRHIDKKGITPDIIVEAKNGLIDVQLDRSLEELDNILTN